MDQISVKRRALIAALGSALLPIDAEASRESSPGFQLGNGEHRAFTYTYTDYWSSREVRNRDRRKRLLGLTPALDQDVAVAEGIIAACPKDSPLSVMRYFASLTAKNSQGEPFHSRWETYENPVIVWFFHATGLKPNGDCTSWCAAFVSWTLDRCGLISKHSASSQAYANYGKEAISPQPGDIVVFQNKGDKNHGHVALFLESKDDKIKIIGGNRGAGAQIPSCPKGYPISSIGEDWREVRDARQPVLTVRRPAPKLA